MELTIGAFAGLGMGLNGVSTALLVLWLLCPFPYKQGPFRTEATGAPVLKAASLRDQNSRRTASALSSSLSKGLARTGPYPSR